MGYEVELASAAGGRSFSETQEATLRAFVTDNSGEYTYAQIAEHFEGGDSHLSQSRERSFLWS